MHRAMVSLLMPMVTVLQVVERVMQRLAMALVRVL